MTRFVFDRITDVLEAIALGMFVACIAIMALAYPARAAEVQPMPASVDWTTTISLAVFFLWIIYLCLPAVRNSIRSVEQDNDDRPHGDTTGWRE